MHLAAQHGFLDIVKELMLVLIEPEHKNPAADDGLTPLHLAARNNHQDVVEYILEFVEDPNPKDMRGMTPLHLAACNNHQKIVKCLLNFVNELNPQDSKGLTPLNLTRLLNGRMAMVRHVLMIWKNKCKL